VKPRHYAPGNHAPALLRQLPWRGHPHHCATLCGMVSNNPRRTVPPTPVRPARRTVKEGRRSPQREGEQLRHARAKTTPRRQAGGIGHLRRHRPCATILVVSDAIPATASPSPTLWKRAVNGTLPRRQLYPRTAPRHGLESSHGWPPNKRPLHHHRTAPPHVKYVKLEQRSKLKTRRKRRKQTPSDEPTVSSVHSVGVVGTLHNRPNKVDTIG
jgi:hypothetical protein